MNEKTEVLYNASCPICRREVDHYAKIARQDNLPIGFDDLGDLGRRKTWGISKEEAAKRLHVRQYGQIYGGIPAFIVLWREIPRMRWLAKVVSLPGVKQVACAVYDHALAPALYHWHLRRERRNQGD